jgi:EAL domain-containing protein (putative c-di-GMP-specific phosphodiesterase class I)
MLRIRLSDFVTLIFLTGIHVVFEDISERDATRHLLALKVTYVCGFAIKETEI